MGSLAVTLLPVIEDSDLAVRDVEVGVAVSAFTNRDPAGPRRSWKNLGLPQQIILLANTSGACGIAGSPSRRGSILPK
jgi:hypothetical protein